jgi:hypothetical protein
VLSQLITAKVAATAALVVLGVGGAAATGSLPGAAQSTAAEALATVGISVPGANGHSAGHADTRGESTTHTSTSTGAGPSADGGVTSKVDDPAGTGGPNAHAQFGLCTAASASAGHPNTNATVFPSAETCSTVVHPGNGSGGPATGATGAIGSHQPANAAGPPASTPAAGVAPVTTPNLGSAAAGHPGRAAAAKGAGNSTSHGRP